MRSSVEVGSGVGQSEDDHLRPDELIQNSIRHFMRRSIQWIVPCQFYPILSCTTYISSFKRHSSRNLYIKRSEEFSVSWLPHPYTPSNPIYSQSHLSVRAIPLPSTIADSPAPHPDLAAPLDTNLSQGDITLPPDDINLPQVDMEWEWRNLDLKLKNLDAGQLAGWRRRILGDMFKGKGMRWVKTTTTTANVAITEMVVDSKGGNTASTVTETGKEKENVTAADQTLSLPILNSTDISPANDPPGEALVDPPPSTLESQPQQPAPTTAPAQQNSELPRIAVMPDGHVPKPIRQDHPARMHMNQVIPFARVVRERVAPGGESGLETASSASETDYSDSDIDKSQVTPSVAGSTSPKVKARTPRPRSRDEKFVKPDHDLRYAYIFQAPLVRGKFDAKKAAALKVPNGAIRKKLIDGEEIEFEVKEGEEVRRVVVRPEEVMEPMQDGGVSLREICSVLFVNMTVVFRG